MDSWELDRIRELLASEAAIADARALAIQMCEEVYRLRALRERDECYHGKHCRCFEHINEALNSGDGTYKP